MLAINVVTQVKKETSESGMFSRDCTNRKLPEIDGNEVAFINYSKKKNLYENTLPKLRQDRIAAAVCF